jgi:tetratricopeptide (TPR) repeat protein
MAELIKALANVKDPLTLLAFLALVALVAFRTKQVPEMLFGLMKEKLTRDRFSHLLHRVMLYGLIAFITLCVVAVFGQFFALKIQAKPFDVSALKDELQKMNVDDASKQSIISEYDKALDLQDQDKIDDAISAMKSALEKARTLTASYTLALMYNDNGKPDDAKKYAEEANKIANRRGSSLDIAKTGELLSRIAKPTPSPLPLPSPFPCGKGFVDDEEELPLGADKRQQAVPISLGRLYVCQQNYKTGDTNYFRVPLKRGQTLVIHFEGAHGKCCSWWVGIDDPGGVRKADAVAESDKDSVASWTAIMDGDYYVDIWGHSPGSLYRFCVR